MKSGTYRQDSLLIVYDAEQVQHPRADLFDPGYWDKRGCVTGEAVGRGSAWFIDAPFGAAVLRRYLRGGMMARISRDRYLFTGWARSRPVAEFRVLERLAAAGLPVASGPEMLLAQGALSFELWTGRKAPVESMRRAMEAEMARRVERVGAIVAEHDGKITHQDHWGVRKLAYEIEKQNKGDYMLLRFESEGPAVAEIDRYLRQDDQVLRHLVVVDEEWEVYGQRIDGTTGADALGVRPVPL